MISVFEAGVSKALCRVAEVQEIPCSNNQRAICQMVYFGSFKPVAESSHTQGARCPASALTILEATRLFIAEPAFGELHPNEGKRQVQERIGDASCWVYF